MWNRVCRETAASARISEVGALLEISERQRRLTRGLLSAGKSVYSLVVSVFQGFSKYKTLVVVSEESRERTSTSRRYHFALKYCQSSGHSMDMSLRRDDTIFPRPNIVKLPL